MAKFFNDSGPKPIKNLAIGYAPVGLPGGGSQVASEVPFTPDGDIAATDVQAAIEEVRDDTDTKLSAKVTGPASATANALVKYDGTTGKLVKDSSVIEDGSGNVGIGRTPVTKLDIAMTTNSATKDEITDFGTGIIYLQHVNDPGEETGIFGGNSPTSISSGIGFRRAPTGWGTEIAFYTHRLAATSLPEIFERMTLGSEGVLDLKMGQLKFPATQNPSADANTLDDYEEGSFTPGFNFGGGITGMSISTQTGWYVKTGRFVIAGVHIALSAKGSATGQAQLTGLPFSATSITNLYFPPSFRVGGLSSTGTVQGYLAYNGTTLNMEQISPAGTLASLDDPNFTDTASIMACFAYII